MASDRTLVLAACATALFATTVLAALVGYAGAVTRDGLRRTLAQNAQIGATAVVSVLPGQSGDTTRQLDQALRRAYGSIPYQLETTARSDSYTLPGQERAQHPELTRFATYTGIDKHAKLTAGRWPAATSDGTAEAVLPAAAARRTKLRPGAVFTVHGRVDKTSAIKVRLVGTFETRSQDDYLWHRDRLVTTGIEQQNYTTHGPLVLTPDVYRSKFSAAGGSQTWFVRNDLSHLDVSGLRALGKRMQDSTNTLRKYGDGTTFAVASDLPELADQLSSAVLVARSTMFVPVLQLILLAGYAWLLVARLLADHRRTELALMRTRGAGMRQLAGITVAEGGAVILPGLLLGPLLADPLLRLAGHAPAVRATGIRLSAGSPGTLWTVAGAAALAFVAAVTVPTLRAVRGTFVETEAAISRGRRGAWAGTGADLALLVVAGLGVWQLTRYNSTPRASGAGGIDPFIVSGPALALLAGGVLLLRLVPVTSRAAERFTTRGRGLAPALGARQVARRPLRYAGPALLLVLAMAVGVLSATTMSTWRLSQKDQADFRAAADVRVSEPSGDLTLGPLGRGARYASLPGVKEAVPVARQGAAYGTAEGFLVAADTRILPKALRVRPDLTRSLKLGALSATRPPSHLMTLPGRPTKLGLDLRLTSKEEAKPLGSGGFYGPWDPYAPGYGITAVLTDARGVSYPVDLTGLKANGRTQSLTVDVTSLAGPQGAISYPLSLRGLRWLDSQNPLHGALSLDVVAVRGEGPGGGPAVLPQGGTWDQWWDDGSGVAAKAVAVKATQNPGVVLTSAIPATELVGLPPAAPTARVSMFVAHGDGPSHDNQPGVPQPMPTVPGVISRSLADRSHAKVGETIELNLARGRQTVRVIGIARAIPGLDAGTDGTLVDLQTLSDKWQATGTAGDDAADPDEWWLSVPGGGTGPAVDAVKSREGLGDVAADRVQLRRDLRDAPLAASLQGALLLGFGAALAFTLIAFTVNAAVAVRERSREFTVLRALGLHQRQVSGMLAVEQAILVGLGLVGGLVLGLVVAKLVVPHIVLTVQAAPPYPPAALSVPWLAVLGLAAGVAVMLGLVLMVVIRVLRKRGLGGDLRAGEDR
ncbi:ABC transporter permease [Actinomadura oligospora]|uniref:ABC transporter permease n=1 Tax=Actinomadura oligospora TaxID=111804 RepID=UPI00047D77F1|nr:FtsX-like permease family protein [Actinomadura oligospora]